MKKYIFLAYILVIFPTALSSWHQFIIPSLDAEPVFLPEPHPPEDDEAAKYFFPPSKIDQSRAKYKAAHTSLTSFLSELELEMSLEKPSLELSSEERERLSMAIQKAEVSHEKIEKRLAKFTRLADAYTTAHNIHTYNLDHYIFWPYEYLDDHPNFKAQQERRENLSETYKLKARFKGTKRDLEHFLAIYGLSVTFERDSLEITHQSRAKTYRSLNRKRDATSLLVTFNKLADAYNLARESLFETL